MSPALAHARRIDSVEDLVGAVVDDAAKVHLPEADIMVRIGLVKAVGLWVEASAKGVSVHMVGNSLVFDSEPRWLKKRLGLRSGNRLYERAHRQAGSGHLSCYLCAAPLEGPREVNVDHWFPRSLGGPDTPWNLRLVHGPCNSRKGDSVLPEAAAAYQDWMGCSG